MTSPDETVSLVDEHGTVVGSAPRRVVRRDNLLHAATAVLVRDSAGRIYVHLRSPDKDWSPSCHDAAAGGVLKHGERPERSALRELEEELGVHDVPLRHLLTERYEDDSVRAVVHCYEATFDGEVVHADGEVVWGAWMTLSELGARLADQAWPFVPDTRALLGVLCRRRVRDYAGLGLPDGPATEGAAT